MNYNPGVSDQRANLIMQGNDASARSGQAAMQLFQYLQDRADRKNAAIGQLTAMGEDDEDSGANGSSAGSGSGFNPSSDADELGNPAMDAAEADGKKAHSIRTMLSNYTDDPQAKTALKAKSLGELEGMLKGYAVKSAMEEHAAKMADFTAQANLRNQQARDDMSIGQAMTRYATAPDVKTDNDEYAATGEETRPATHDERMRLAMTGVSGRAVPKLITALSQYGQTQDDTITDQREIYPGVSVLSTRRGNVQVVTNPAAKNGGDDLKATYTEDPVTGSRALLYGKTAQPTGFNPDVAKSTLVPQHDEDNNLVGWSQVDARGHATWIPNRQGPMKAAKDENGNPIPGYYQTPEGKLLDSRTVLEKHLGAAKSAAAPATALPMPKTKSSLVKGKLYATPRGVAKWDGDQFVPQ